MSSFSSRRMTMPPTASVCSLAVLTKCTTLPHSLASSSRVSWQETSKTWDVEGVEVEGALMVDLGHQEALAWVVAVGVVALVGMTCTRFSTLCLPTNVAWSLVKVVRPSVRSTSSLVPMWNCQGHPHQTLWRKSSSFGAILSRLSMPNSLSMSG